MTTTAAPLRGVVGAVATAPELDVMGTTVRTLLTSAQTGGAFALFQMEADPGLGVPMHVHDRDDETFLVLAGELEVTVGGTVHRVGPGMHAFGPRGIEHSWFAAGEQRASFYLMTTPGGIESMFDRLAQLTGPPDMSKIAPICEAAGVRFC